MADTRREFNHLFKCLTPTCRLYVKLASSVNHILCKSRLIQSRVNGPIIVLPTLEGFRKMTEGLNEGRKNDVLCPIKMCNAIFIQSLTPHSSIQNCLFFIDINTIEQYCDNAETMGAFHLHGQMGLTNIFKARMMISETKTTEK